MSPAWKKAETLHDAGRYLFVEKGFLIFRRQTTKLRSMHWRLVLDARKGNVFLCAGKGLDKRGADGFPREAHARNQALALCIACYLLCHIKMHRW